MARTKLRPVEDLPNKNWMRDATCYTRGRSFIDGTDEVARAMEAKWGVDRLRCLVSDELRARFDSQRVKFHDAISDGELADVEREALRMRKAWEVLDRAAEDSGATGPSDRVWEVALPDGSVAAIVQDTDGYQVAMASGRALKVYLIEEIANLIHGFPDLAKIKDEFPGAKVVSVKGRTDPLRDMEFSDDLPF